MSTINTFVKHSETGQMGDEAATRQCETARLLERAGEYEAARESLAGLWSTIGQRPNSSGLRVDVEAEVLLRVGALAGWLGSSRQITGAQEFAKDLIGESIRLFESVGDGEKVAEAQTDLAICYWREGAFDEGRVLFREATQRAVSAGNQLRALVNSTIVEISSGRYNEAMNLLDQAMPLLKSVSDEGSHGRFHMQRALVLKRLGGQENLDRALIEDTAASFHFEKAGHKRYLARVENNIGFILLQLNRPADSIQHLERARSIFLALKDAGSVAQVNETRARVFFSQKQYAQAERAATAAVSTLELGGEQSLLSEALVTQGTILVALGKYHTAQMAFERAATVAESAGDSLSAGNARLIQIQELQSFLTPSQIMQAFRQADECLPHQLNSETATRLRSCMRIIAATGTSETAPVAELEGGTLEEKVLYVEANLIKQALDRENGSITRAAHLLGLTHQGLAYILNNRHKALLPSRVPARRRHKSIIRKH
jgi:tetratricopeptide (TPR) repeat protein